VRKIIKRRSVRIAVLSAAGLVGAGAMGALAIPAIAAVPTITFKGGCHTLSATSVPDPTELTTQKSATSDRTADVIVVNKLNTSGKLYADGRQVRWPGGKVVVLDKGDSVTVPLTSGGVELMLVPECEVAGLNTDLKEDFEVATVTVLAAPRPGGQGEDSPDVMAAEGETTVDSGTAADGSVSRPDASDGPNASEQPAARDAVPPEAADGAVTTRAGGDEPGGMADVPRGDPKAAPLVPKNHTSGTGTMILAWVAALCLAGVVLATLRRMVFVRSARVSGS
jgi:hypothetical protein